MTPGNGFAKGTIDSVTLKNFMTYKYVKLKAGPDLNMVLGPNGTGKSALVCGIIIGLGGDASATGRSGSMKNYIKFGCESAEVTIVLCNANGSNYEIRRKLMVTGTDQEKCTSEWTLNGQPSKQTDVRSFISELNIRVDNLCQFLPQEKVVEFAKMSCEELLQNTEKAAGDVELFSSHEKLCKLSKEVRELEKNKNTLNYQTNTEATINRNVEQDIQRIRERQSLEKKIKSMSLKRPWLLYYDCKNKYEETKNSFEEKNEYYKTHSKNLEPLKKKLHKTEIVRKKMEIDVVKLTKDLEVLEAKLRKYGDNLESKLDNFSIADFKSRFAEEEARLRAVASLKEEISNLKNKIQDAVSNESNRDNAAELAQTDQDIKILTTKRRGNQEKVMQLQEDKDHVERKRSEAVRTKNYLQNINSQRMDLVQRHKREAYDAAKWLDSNKNKFGHTIHPPILTQVNVTNKACVKQLESAIPNRELYAFVCEDKDDLRIFTEHMKQLRLRVATVMAPDDTSLPGPRTPLQDIKKFGFTTYLSDVFNAPDAVKAYLCNQCRLNDIPVGDENTANHIDKLERMGFQKFYSGDTCYQLSRSRYDNSAVTSSEQIRDAQLLVISVDERQLRAVNQSIAKCEEDLNKISSEITMLANEKQAIESDIQNLRKKQEDLTKFQKYKAEIESRLTHRESMLRAKESQKLDTENEKRKALGVSGSVNKERRKLLRTYYDMNRDYVKLHQEKLKKSGLLVAVTAVKKRTDAQLRQSASEFDNLKDELERLKQRSGEKKREAVILRNKACDALRRNGTQIQDNDALPPEVDQLFEELPENLLELEDEIDRCENLVETLGGRNADDQNLEADYNHRSNIIRNKGSEIKKLEKSLTDKRQEMASVKEQWLPPLEELISKINVNFSQLMTKLNYAGEIVLKSDTEEDFDKYGIGVKVKYRESEELQELSNFQSGGERSVATMIYMIALQELTKVPFRCVDEINQGMDASNERRIFDIIVQKAAESSSQYFLFSPKLLMDLHFTDNMTIHIISNGTEIEKDWPNTITEAA